MAKSDRLATSCRLTTEYPISTTLPQVLSHHRGKVEQGDSPPTTCYQRAARASTQRRRLSYRSPKTPPDQPMTSQYGKWTRSALCRSNETGPPGSKPLHQVAGPDLSSPSSVDQRIRGRLPNRAHMRLSSVARSVRPLTWNNRVMIGHRARYELSSANHTIKPGLCNEIPGSARKNADRSFRLQSDESHDLTMRASGPFGWHFPAAMLRSMAIVAGSPRIWISQPWPGSCSMRSRETL